MWCRVVAIKTPIGPTGMVLIPGGNFTMGATFANKNATDERPVHTVYVSVFFMNQFEVTKAKWDEVWGWAINNGDGFAYEGSGKAQNHPVQTVNWYDCVKWCNALSEKEGRTPAYYTSSERTTVYRTDRVDISNDWVRWGTGYRLPTEAEWEKAARVGTKDRRFPCTDSYTIQHARANYYSSSIYAYDTSPTRGNHPTYNDWNPPYTSPAGSFAPNGYGLHDMAGNVREWCWDWHSPNYNGAASSNPRGPTSGSFRVCRNGGWNGYADECRLAYRGSLPPVNTTDAIGFRLALPIDQ